MANFQLNPQARSHRSQEKGYDLPLVELQNILNDILTDSPHLGRARHQLNLPPTEEDNPLGSNLMTIQWSKHLNVVNEARGQGLVEVVVTENGRGGRGHTSLSTSRIDFDAITEALTPQERTRHQEEGLCLKSHKKGHRVF
jgi:hypothetical protein